MLYKLTVFNTHTKKAEKSFLLESRNVAYMMPNDYGGTTITTSSGIITVSESMERIEGKVRFVDITERPEIV